MSREARLARGLAVAWAIAGGSALAEEVHHRGSARLALGLGYDDNLLSDGQGGGALFAVQPGLAYTAEGRHLALEADYEGRWWRFWDRPERNAAFHQLRFELGGTVGRHVELKGEERLRYAADPVALARMGLLGSTTPAVRHLARGEIAFPFARRAAIVGRARHDLVIFFADGILPSWMSGRASGGALAGDLALRWDATRRTRLEAGYRLKLFADGLSVQATSHGGHGQISWRATRRWTVGALAGASWLGGEDGTELLPRLRLFAEWVHRAGTLVFSASRDVGIGGQDSPEPIYADQVELALERSVWGPLWARISGGLYRSGAPPDFAGDIAGYLATAVLWVKLGRGFSAGARAERFAMLWGDVEPGRYDRNQLAAELAWSVP